MRPIDADAIPYTMLYKEDWMKGTGVEKPGVWKDTIDAMPTIELERKSGRWIEDGYNNYKAVCSECGEPCGTYVMGKPRDNFCKWCGAKMEADT